MENRKIKIDFTEYHYDDLVYELVVDETNDFFTLDNEMQATVIYWFLQKIGARNKDLYLDTQDEDNFYENKEQLKEYKKLYSGRIADSMHEVHSDMLQEQQALSAGKPCL